MIVIKSCPGIHIGYGVYGNTPDPWDDYEEEDDEDDEEDCDGE